MSTLKTTNIQHPSAEEPAIELLPDGTVKIKATIEPKVDPFFLMGA
jgi:hypothetical protein